MVLPLGLGGSFNHDDEANVYAHRYADQPLLQAWVAVRGVPKGSELFISYGSAYWDAPWRGEGDEHAGPSGGDCLCGLRTPW